MPDSAKKRHAAGRRAAVVIPVRGGNRRIADNIVQVVSAAEAADLPAFVVDNGASRVVREQVRRRTSARLVICARVGSYAARNVGVERALAGGADTILFVDADCRASELWPDHLLQLADRYSVITSLALPRGRGLVARSIRADYLARLEEWGGSPLRCGMRFGTLDTRACAIRAEVFQALRFDERIRYAGDAMFGRRAAAAGFTVVSCDHACISHDPPAPLRSELAKVKRTAGELATDLQYLPRAEVLRWLPEHAHLRLALATPRGDDSRHTAARSLRALVRRDWADAYAALRVRAWLAGCRDRKES